MHGSVFKWNQFNDCPVCRDENISFHSFRTEIILLIVLLSYFAGYSVGYFHLRFSK